MKKIIKNILLGTFSLALVFSVSSCEKTYFEDVNLNPNNPTDVPPAVLLPAIQAQVAYAQGGDMARWAAIFTQQIRGVSRQFVVFDNYNFTQGDFDNLWRLNLYAGPLMDLYTLNNLCKENGYVRYGAVGKIMMAYTLGITTDCFGDMPYSQAFMGTSNISPAYDRQSDIYARMNAMLNEAIVELDATDNSGVTVGVEDFLFGGNLAKWKKFANSLLARNAIHLSKIDNMTAANNALAAIAAGGFAANSDDAQFRFAEGPTTANPWFQYIEQRDDIGYENNYLIDTLMPSMSDPRLSIYIEGGTLGSFYASENSPVFFMTYAELKFIEAEANVILGNTSNAQSALTDAITAHMNKVGITDATAISDFITANATLTGTQAGDMNIVMLQKYVAMYLQPEAWTDWRRTGIPNLSPNAGAAVNYIPRRFLYPQSENDNNRNSMNAAIAAQGCSNAVSLNCRVWWDN